MTEKKRRRTERRPRLVWIDWALLLLLGAATLFGVRFLIGRRDAAEPTVEILYTLCLSDRDAALAENGEWSALIPYGTTVTNATGTVTMGSVSAVTVRTHRTVAVQDGAVVTVEVPDRVDLLVTVRAGATRRTGDGLRVSDIRIAAGGTGDFRIGEVYADNARVIAVERKGRS